MRRGLRIGRVLGIPIEIDVTWFVIFGLVTVAVAGLVMAEAGPASPQVIGWLLGGFAALVFFASLLGHELAHAYVAQRLGVEISSVRLFIFGGVARMDREPRSSGEEWRIAAAGPACSFALAAFFAAVTVWTRLLTGQPLLSAMTRWLAQMNLALAVFNLLPGLPLDGGRLLRAGLWRATGNLVSATRVAALGGKVMGYALVVWGLALVFRHQVWGLVLILVGLFLVSLAASGYRRVGLQHTLQGVPVSQIMSAEVPAVAAAVTVEQLVRDYLPKEARTTYLVVRGDDVVGRVSLSDVRRLEREHWPYTPVGDIAAPLADDEFVAPAADSWEAALEMAGGDHPHLFVVEEGRVLGVVRRRDLVRLLRTKGQHV